MAVDLAVKVEPQPVGLAQLSSVLKILCEQNRMRILCFLMQGERSVCDLAACLNLPQNLVSHHLSVLRERAGASDAPAATGPDGDSGDCQTWIAKRSLCTSTA